MHCVLVISCYFQHLIHCLCLCIYLQALEKPARLPGQPPAAEEQEAKPPGGGQSQPPATSTSPQLPSGVQKDGGQAPQKPVSMHSLCVLARSHEAT